MPLQWKALIDAHLAELPPTGPVFKRATEREWSKLSAAITQALRTADPTFGQRALRRGALQTIAADPAVDLATVRLFSGHTNDGTALRYLNWGQRAANRARCGQQAAAALFPTATTTTTARRTHRREGDDDSTTSSEGEQMSDASPSTLPRRH